MPASAAGRLRAGCGPARPWCWLALAAACAWVVGLRAHAAGRLPLHFAGRYFVLDATSMLFLLVINSVFLGISVYMSSRVSTSRVLADSLLPRAGR